MKSLCFHDSKLKFMKALLFRSFHETDAPTAFYQESLQPIPGESPNTILTNTCVVGSNGERTS